MPITDSESTKEPDLCALNVFDVPSLITEGGQLPSASLHIVELKRPMRNDASSGEEDDPIEQCLGYSERIRTGKVTTADGTHIPPMPIVPAFCYVLCDLTPRMLERCKVHDLTLCADGAGYFGYKKAYNAYIEVISFAKLARAAKERNRAFFDKLGLPSR